MKNINIINGKGSLNDAILPFFSKMLCKLILNSLQFPLARRFRPTESPVASGFLGSTGMGGEGEQKYQFSTWLKCSFFIKERFIMKRFNIFNKGPGFNLRFKDMAKVGVRGTHGVANTGRWAFCVGELCGDVQLLRGTKTSHHLAPEIWWLED